MGLCTFQTSGFHRIGLRNFYHPVKTKNGLPCQFKPYITENCCSIKYCDLGYLLQEFACNGTVVEHPEYGEVLQLQGDQRTKICEWLVQIGLAKQDQIKVHGF